MSCPGINLGMQRRRYQALDSTDLYIYFKMSGELIVVSPSPPSELKA